MMPLIVLKFLVVIVINPVTLLFVMIVLITAKSRDVPEPGCKKVRMVHGGKAPRRSLSGGETAEHLSLHTGGSNTWSYSSLIVPI